MQTSACPQSHYPVLNVHNTKTPSFHFYTDSVTQGSQLPNTCSHSECKKKKISKNGVMLSWLAHKLKVTQTQQPSERLVDSQQNLQISSGACSLMMKIYWDWVVNISCSQNGFIWMMEPASIFCTCNKLTFIFAVRLKVGGTKLWNWKAGFRTQQGPFLPTCV